jgi:signal transduction histidine kinase
LFDPFVTAGKPNGTGLGLTLARRIAEEHGGSVGIEESNGERTIFTLSLRKNRLLALEGPDCCTDHSRNEDSLKW